MSAAIGGGKADAIPTNRCAHGGACDNEGSFMSIGDYIRNTQVWKSIFRHPAPRDRRNRVVVMLTNVFLHLHPVSVRKSGIELSYTWCMGGITFFLFLVETVTGVLLMFYYRPTLEHAYNDILSLRDVTTLGILRELHRWGEIGRAHV